MKYGFIPQPRIYTQNPFAVLSGVFWYNRKGEVFPLLFLFPFVPKLDIGNYVVKRRESVKKQLSVVFPRADRAAARTSGRERKFLLKISSSEPTFVFWYKSPSPRTSYSYTPARGSRRLLHEIHSLKILLPSIIKNDRLRSFFLFNQRASRDGIRRGCSRCAP